MSFLNRRKNKNPKQDRHFRALRAEFNSGEVSVGGRSAPVTRLWWLELSPPVGDQPCQFAKLTNEFVGSPSIWWSCLMPAAE